MLKHLSGFIPLMLTASLSTAAWDSSHNYNGLGHTAMTGGFGFSMGFRGRGHSTFGNRPLVLRGVNFEFDSARLTPDSSIVLDDVAANLRTTPELQVEVGGHASDEGDDTYNLDLSTRRAHAVRDYLIEAGVDASTVRANGYGETRPLVSNGNETGRSANRRVELIRL